MDGPLLTSYTQTYVIHHITCYSRSDDRCSHVAPNRHRTSLLARARPNRIGAKQRSTVHWHVVIFHFPRFRIELPI